MSNNRSYLVYVSNSSAVIFRVRERRTFSFSRKSDDRSRKNDRHERETESRREQVKKRRRKKIFNEKGSLKKKNCLRKNCLIVAAACLHEERVNATDRLVMNRRLGDPDFPLLPFFLLFLLLFFPVSLSRKCQNSSFFFLFSNVIPSSRTRARRHRFFMHRVSIERHAARSPRG